MNKTDIFITKATQIHNNFYDYKTLLKIINNINTNEVNMFLKAFFNNTGITIVFYGNIDKKKLPKFNV